MTVTEKKEIKRSGGAETDDWFKKWVAADIIF